MLIPFSMRWETLLSPDPPEIIFATCASCWLTRAVTARLILLEQTVAPLSCRLSRPRRGGATFAISAGRRRGDEYHQEWNERRDAFFFRPIGCDANSAGRWLSSN